jgi:transcriptional regulator with XRE-family HTH domain
MPSNGKKKKAFLRAPSLPGRIRKFLEDEQLSQHKAAKKMKTSQQTFAKWCLGLNLPNLKNTYRLSDMMGVTVQELLPIHIEDLED